MEEMESSLDEWIALFETRRLGKMRVRRKSDGVLVGRCGYGIYAPTGEPEIGYSLYPEFWGNGYAFEAASGMRDWIFRETGEPHFIGMADVRNTASLKVLERIGMTKTEVLPSDGVQVQFHVMRRPA
jgi:RimJ/RimL family protein N-acetyltransferase